MKQILTLIMVMFCVTASAQKTVVTDTIDAESLADRKSVTQHKWSKYEYVDTCTTRYAVVHDWIGRCGIYDLEKHENLTELEYHQLYYSQDLELEDGTHGAMFYGGKGRRDGVVSVSPSGGIVTIMKDNDDAYYSLDECRTIDKRITKFCQKTLKKNLEKVDSVQYAEVLVMDTQSGHIKAWVAMQDETCSGKFAEARPRRHSCTALPYRNLMAYISIVDANLILQDIVDTGYGLDSIGGLRIKDHSFYKGGFGRLSYRDAFKQHSYIAMAKAIHAADSTNFKRTWMWVNRSPRETDVMKLAATYSSIALGGIDLRPSVNTDSVCVVYDEDNHLTIKQAQMAKDIMKAALQEDGIGSSWTTKKVDIAGDYITHRNCCPTLFDDNAADLEKWQKAGFRNYDQVIFTGYFPTEQPKYTICVVMDKKGSPAYGKLLGNAVNKLAEYLNQH